MRVLMQHNGSELRNSGRLLKLAIIAISGIPSLNLDAESGYKMSIATDVKRPACFAEEKILFSM